MSEHPGQNCDDASPFLLYAFTNPQAGGMVALEQMEQAVPLPPPLKDSSGNLRCFIRKYPEHFVVETRIKSGEIFVGLPSSSGYDIPRWL